VENKAASAWHRMKQLSGQRAAAGREVQAAVAAKEEAEKKLEKLDHWYPGKLIIGEAKRQAKHDTRQQEYEETCKRLGQAQGKTAELDTQVKNATKEAEALQEQVEELKRARGQLAELQQRIFVAPEWAGHPMLSALGRDAADMERRAAEVSGSVTATPAILLSHGFTGMQREILEQVPSAEAAV